MGMYMEVQEASCGYVYGGEQAVGMYMEVQEASCGYVYGGEQAVGMYMEVQEASCGYVYGGEQAVGMYMEVQEASCGAVHLTNHQSGSEEVRHASRNADSVCPFCIGSNTKKGRLSQNL